jgi:hypothetical protein
MNAGVAFGGIFFLQHSAANLNYSFPMAVPALVLDIGFTIDVPCHAESCP